MRCQVDNVQYHTYPKRKGEKKKGMKFASWNVRGINSQIKRSKILNHLKKLNADICLLQETHLLESEHKKLQNSQFSSSLHLIAQRREE